MIDYSYVDGALRATETREVPSDEQPAWWRAAVDFVASIKDVPWFQPQGEPAPEWRVFDTRAAAGDAAKDAAKDAVDAARNAARDASGTAAETSGRGAAWNAAGVAAWGAAMTVAGDAAETAVWNAIGDAPWDAGLLAWVHICAGLDLDQRHVVHAHARWDVWRRGYRLLCDVDGVLYVYLRPA